MGEQLGTVLAALIGVVGALGGTFLGRRQVGDQAAVEHGQWLRGQRQEAYGALLEVWNAGLKRFDEMVENWEGEHHAAETFEGDGWLESERSIYRDTYEIFETVKRAIERVELLGPEDVDTAAAQMTSALRAVRGAVRSKAGSEDWPDSTAYNEALAQADAARRGFLTAARVATRSAPRPGARETRRRWGRGPHRDDEVVLGNTGTSIHATRRLLASVMSCGWCDDPIAKVIRRHDGSAWHSTHRRCHPLPSWDVARWQ